VTDPVSLVFARRLHPIAFEELTHAFMESSPLSLFGHYQSDCGRLGLSLEHLEIGYATLPRCRLRCRLGLRSQRRIGFSWLVIEGRMGEESRTGDSRVAHSGSHEYARSN
jgi:hypothetical protein